MVKKFEICEHCKQLIDLPRDPSIRDKVISALKSAGRSGSLSNVELSKALRITKPQSNRAIRLLRDQGYTITMKRVTPYVVNYQLVV